MSVSSDRLSTGVPGLDEVLNGGLLARQSYLLRGEPGAGKTTLGLQFLAAGDRSLLVNLGEHEEVLERTAAGFGLDLSGVEVVDLSPTADVFLEEESYDVFSPAEVERGAVVDELKRAVEAHQPSRVVVDPVAQLRYLTHDQYQFHKQLLGLFEYLTSVGATVLFTSQDRAGQPDDDLQFLSDGILELANEEQRRSLTVTKFRASDYREGAHTLSFEEHGLHVYPKLVPDEYGTEVESDVLTSGIPMLDELMGGGVNRGTVTMISGPSGAGKTTLGTRLLQAAADRGERSVLYLFEESAETLLMRSDAIGLPVAEMIDEGTLALREVEPLKTSADEFASDVRHEVEQRGAEVVMLDGVSGYELSIAGPDLQRELHALCRYLRNMGTTTVLIEETEQVTGELEITSYGGTYLADNLLFLRHVEAGGRLQKVIGMLKKRTGDHERTLREFEVTDEGIEVGEPPSGLQGVLSGVPTTVDDTAVSD